MAKPVSWLLVERGWQVIGSGGEELGKVDAVLGDAGLDIFNGITVSHGLLGRPRYVPAELVREIFEGRVVLDVDHERFEELGEYDEATHGGRVPQRLLRSS